MCTILPVKIMHPPQIVSEDDWCLEHIQTVEDKGQQSTVAELYRASKVLAEQRIQYSLSYIYPFADLSMWVCRCLAVLEQDKDRSYMGSSDYYTPSCMFILLIVSYNSTYD